jgi:lipopolysaccharide assembly outer membrane protein LptD (OstA)
MRARSFKIILAVLLVIIIVYIIKESEKINLLDTFLPEKIAVFKNVHMAGIEASGEAWEIFAKEGWTGRDKFATTLEFVSDAKITKKGRIMVKDLKARRVRLSRNKDIEIFKKVDDKDPDQYLKVKIDFGAFSKSPKKKKEFSYLTADYIKFNPDTKSGVLRGKILIIKEDLHARSENVSLDLNDNIATFESRSFFNKDKSRLAADSAVAFFDEDKINMSGSIEVIQKNKIVTADNAIYDDNNKTIVLRSRTKATIEKLKNIIKEGTAKKYKSDESQKALGAKTILTADQLKIWTENNDAIATGNVHVYQQDKEVRSDKANYSEKNEFIIMTGNVFMKKKDDWVRADKVIVSVDKETFEAFGGVETTFKVKKGSKR